MVFPWVKIGNQENWITERCYLGPWMLSVYEWKWVDVAPQRSDLIVKCEVDKWDNNTMSYVSHVDLGEYLHGEGKPTLEDWYANNVLFDNVVLGG